MNTSLSLSSKNNPIQSLNLNRLVTPDNKVFMDNNHGKRSNPTLTNSISIQSSNLPGITLLNPETLKPLRIERFDQRNKSIKWFSENSDLAEKGDPSNNKGDDISGSIKKMIMSRNERRRMNQNNLEDKLLSLKIRDLERQQTNIQSHLKRERFKLLDHFLDSKADNLSYNKRKAEEENQVSVSLVVRALKAHEDSKSYRSNLTESTVSMNLNNPLFGDKNISLAIPQPILNSITQRAQMNNKKLNSHSNITERFIEQKSKYFPSYLKPRTKLRNSSSATDIDQIISRVKKMSDYDRKICSKHKQHRLAKIKADMYFSSKDFPELMNPQLEEHLDQNDSTDLNEELKAPGSNQMARDNNTLPTISSAKTNS